MRLKIAIIAAALSVFAVKAEPIPQYGVPFNNGINNAPISSYGTPNYNVNNGQQSHDHNEPKAYEFGYQVKDDSTGNNYGRQERSDGNQVTGEYRVQLPDGRTQIVTYYADWQTGYHADVRYEGQAQYPDQYNTNNNVYNNPPNQYVQPGYNSNQRLTVGQAPDNQNYNAGNNYNEGNNYNTGYNYNAPGRNSVGAREFSDGSNRYNAGNNYNSEYNYNGINDGLNFAGNYGNRNRPSPAYGSP